MRTDLFDFDLPDHAIALEPVTPRDAARLLVVRPSSPSPRATPPSPRPSSTRGEGRGEGRMQTRAQAAAPHPNPLPASPRAFHTPDLPKDGPRASGERGSLEFEDRVIRDLPDLLRPGDALVLNDTRVIRAALTGERLRGENRAVVAFNLHRRVDESRWRAFARPAKRLAVGDRIRFGNEGRVCLLGVLDATVAAIGEGGEVELSFNLHGAYLDEAIEALGDPPLPPYIAGRRAVTPEDAERYQTVYARREGAVAAPTAGLHFTDRLLAALEARGVSRHFVTLHVGAGTFLPVKVEDTGAHRMHAEWGEISADTAAALNKVRAAGGRIVAVGTTALRLVETAAGAVPSPLVGEGQGGGEPPTSVVGSPPTPNPSPQGGGELGRHSLKPIIHPFAGETRLFITPGYRFRAVDLLLTNFHLPRSTLFMLVVAFSGIDVMQRAYAHAIRSGYRFYSYGDACLLHPAADAHD